MTAEFSCWRQLVPWAGWQGGSTVTQHYLGTSTTPAYETDANNNLMARWMYNSADQPVLMVTGSHVYSYVYTGTGNVAGLIDDTSGSPTFGQEVVTYTYDAWGNLLNTTDNSGINLSQLNPYTYKAYWYVPGLKLYLLGARVYNPAWGRFLSPDPLAYASGAITDYNGYSYASNNPIALADPTGLLDGPWNRPPHLAIPPSAFLAGLLMFVPGVGEEFIAARTAAEEIAVLDAVSTRSVAYEVGSKLGGTVSKIGGDVNSWKVIVPNGRRSIIVRIMEAGSGGRENPYFKVSIDGKPALTLQGKFSGIRIS